MQEQVEKFDLDRVTNIENNIDAFGKKWNIVRHNKQNAMLVARPEPFRADFVCPKEFQGKWTSFDKLQELVKLHVTRSWDQADQAKVKAERAAQALVEQEKIAKDLIKMQAAEAAEAKKVAKVNKKTAKVQAK